MSSVSGTWEEGDLILNSVTGKVKTIVTSVAIQDK